VGFRRTFEGLKPETNTETNTETSFRRTFEGLKPPEVLDYLVVSGFQTNL